MNIRISIAATIILVAVFSNFTARADEFSDGVLTVTESSVASRKYYNRTDIMKIIFPENISGINSFAFFGCQNLKEVIFTGKIPYFKEGAFYNCNDIDRVEIQPEYLASWAGTFTDYSWDRPYGKDLYLGSEKVTDLVIPESVSRIGTYAFYGFHNIESVHWPGHGISVADGGLPFRTIKSIYCNSITDWIESGIDGRPFYPTSEFYINGQKCPSVIEIPEGVSRIGSGCFNGNTDIVELVIPESVQDMGYAAFQNCVNLKKLIIKTDRVGYQDRLFADCTSLEEIICFATVPPSISDNAFAGVSKSTCRVVVPEGSIQQYRDDEYWGKFANITAITTGIKQIKSAEPIISCTDNGIIIYNVWPTTVVRIYNAAGQELTKTIAESEVIVVNQRLTHGVYYIVVSDTLHKIII